MYPQRHHYNASMMCKRRPVAAEQQLHLKSNDVMSFDPHRLVFTGVSLSLYPPPLNQRSLGAGSAATEGSNRPNPRPTHCSPTCPVANKAGISKGAVCAFGSDWAAKRVRRGFDKILLFLNQSPWRWNGPDLTSVARRYPSSVAAYASMSMDCT
jgi:hypothetical protein